MAWTAVMPGARAADGSVNVPGSVSVEANAWVILAPSEFSRAGTFEFEVRHWDDLTTVVELSSPTCRVIDRPVAIDSERIAVPCRAADGTAALSIATKDGVVRTVPLSKEPIGDGSVVLSVWAAESFPGPDVPILASWSERRFGGAPGENTSWEGALVQGQTVTQLPPTPGARMWTLDELFVRRLGDADAPATGFAVAAGP